MMQSWADIVRKQPQNVNTSIENNISIGKFISIRSSTVNHPKIKDKQEYREKQDNIIIKNSIKHIDREKIAKLIHFRTCRNLNQSKFANLISVPQLDIRDAEQGKEISLSTYQSIFNYIDRHKLQ
jgi:hypothetical protein